MREQLVGRSHTFKAQIRARVRGEEDPLSREYTVSSSPDDFVCDRCRESVDHYRQALLSETSAKHIDWVLVENTAGGSYQPLRCAMCDLVASYLNNKNGQPVWNTGKDKIPGQEMAVTRADDAIWQSQDAHKYDQNSNERSHVRIWACNSIGTTRRNKDVSYDEDNTAFGLMMGRTVWKGKDGIHRDGNDAMRPIIMLMEGSLKPEHPGNRHCARMINQEKADFAGFRQRISQCIENHAVCARHKKEAKVRRVFPSHAIDCENLQIAPLPDGADYVTLSYVWGPQNHSESDPPKSTLHNASRVVTDAMSITKELGFRYLWVDKYCIKQDDPAHKMSQISIMDSIYENAVVTLVDGVGDNDQHGLPGAGTLPLVLREKQKFVCVGPSSFGLVTMDVRQALRGVKWSSRGWTYQEAILSSRCLIFTRSQVFFICKTTCRCESLPRLPHSESYNGYSVYRQGGGYKEVTLHNLFHPQGPAEKHPIRYGQVGGNSWLLGLINQYINRELSYEEDRLNAFIGVLARYKYHSYWGIPLIQGKDNLITLCEDRDGAKHYEGIQAAFIRGLCWQVETRLGITNKAKRNCNMPTWSWLGLSNCSVTFPQMPENVSHGKLCTWDEDIEISIPSAANPSGEARPIGELWQEYMVNHELGKIISNDCKVIVLDVLVAQVAKFLVGPYDEYSTYGRFSITTDMDCDSSLDQQDVSLRVEIDCCSEFAKDFKIEMWSKEQQAIQDPDLLVARVDSATVTVTGFYSGPPRHLYPGIPPMEEEAMCYLTTYLLLQPVSKSENTWKRIGIVEPSSFRRNPLPQERFRKQTLILT